MEAFIGTLIRRERLKQNYSQEGLCKGICVVSYLSKIEQGRVDAGQEIIAALLGRLGISYETDAGFLERAGDTVEQLYELIFSGRAKEQDFEGFRAESSRYLSSRYMLDAMLLLLEIPYPAGNMLEASEDTGYRQQIRELGEYVSGMSGRQYGYYLFCRSWYGEDNFEELLKLNPNGFYLTQAGSWHWSKGEYIQAIELLGRGYHAASEEGTVYNMLLAKVILGNCYSSINSQELMLRQYKVAKQIALAIGADDYIQEIDYNIAATFLEWGKAEEAEPFFKKCGRRDTMYYHKYALCMEKLGRIKEAQRMLQKGRQTQGFGKFPVYQEMYGLVEYRLEHPVYWEEREYERKLRSCMEHMQTQLPSSYEKFHVPYLIEILEHKRKYKEICHLMRKFSLG